MSNGVFKRLCWCRRQNRLCLGWSRHGLYLRPWIKSKDGKAWEVAEFYLIRTQNTLFWKITFHSHHYPSSTAIMSGQGYNLPWVFLQQNFYSRACFQSQRVGIWIDEALEMFLLITGFLPYCNPSRKAELYLGCEGKNQRRSKWYFWQFYPPNTLYQQ